MPRFTETDDVAFTEDVLQAPVLGTLRVRARRQNATLLELKMDMARQAKLLGGNAIMRFTYTQTADSPLRNVLSLRWDSERLLGTGDVIRLER